MIGSKVMALLNRYSGLARPDIRLTEWQFHIYSKEKETLIKIRGWSNGQIKSYGPSKPLL
jgi:hypothetical protein